MENKQKETVFDLPLVDMSLMQLADEVWAARLFIAVGSAIGLITAIVFLLIVTPQYRAEMILSPASPLSSAVDTSVQSNDAFLLFMNLYAGPSLSRSILSNNHETLANLSNDKPFFLSPAAIDKNPSAAELSSYLKRNIYSEKIGTTTLERLSYTHPDPKFAAKFLNIVHTNTDNLIRASSKASAAARIAYLENALNRTHNADQRRALTGLLMEHEYIYMLTKMSEPFAARVVEPPSTSIRPIWPRKGTTILILVMLGAMGGFILRIYLSRGSNNKVTS